METVYSKAVTRHDMTVHYELIAGDGGYGIRVITGGEAAVIPALTVDRAALFHLLEVMILGFVTPVTARDVAEDWLLR